ncbi:PREDICTED: cyclin-SDS-like [Nicotiana attenuata]|uniref:Cyclin-sds n=1 Tax=Nicotiana attenuata TaxID=49451 RepID=A0A1J6JER6_NICAT|nr:PREDICTED: cyclin-SDS-like [Nicotiana attenuata]OIT05545.1 cyclin-sds [Nicotiana attenuata]
MKRKLHSEALQPAVKKQLRSKLPRRRRSHISPILHFSIAGNSSHLTCEVSRDSSKSSVNKETAVKKREIEGDEFRRITRAYYRKNMLENDQKKDAYLELSECSCVDSCSEIIGKIMKNEYPVDILSKQNRNIKDIEGTEDSDAISQFLKTSADFCGKSSKNAAKINDEDVASFNSVLQSPAESDYGKSSVQTIKCSENRTAEDVVSFNSVLQSPSESKCANSSVQTIKCSENRAAEDVVSFNSVLQSPSESKYANSLVQTIKCSQNRAAEDVFSINSVLQSPSESKCANSSVQTIKCSENRAAEDVVSFNSVLQSPSESKCANSSVQTIKCRENRAAEFEEVELSAEEQAREKLVEAEFDLECSENFSMTDISDDYSSAYSELQSEIFPESSDIDLSDYSLWYDDSGSQFSEKSNADATPSHTFTLFLQFSQHFFRSTVALQSPSINSSDDHISTEFTEGWDEEDEESYLMIRKRERRQLYLHDYAEEYCSTTDYGELIVQQRLHMVHWILAQATRKDLQKETMFLSVNLFDRLLSKGYFKTKRCLQIAGIACLTLAVRIEENQPYNSIRQKTFVVADTAYSCCEVVAMEWLVQEVLNFQCFLPTIYNFLWFYLKAARAGERVERTAKYLAVLALLSHDHLCYRPSTVASSLVFLASSSANLYASCYLVTKTHAKMKDDDLPECIKSLEWLVRYI